MTLRQTRKSPNICKITIFTRTQLSLKTPHSPTNSWKWGWTVVASRSAAQWLEIKKLTSKLLRKLSSKTRRCEEWRTTLNQWIHSTRNLISKGMMNRNLSSTLSFQMNHRLSLMWICLLILTQCKIRRDKFPVWIARLARRLGLRTKRSGFRKP